MFWAAHLGQLELFLSLRYRWLSTWQGLRKVWQGWTSPHTASLAEQVTHLQQRQPVRRSRAEHPGWFGVCEGKTMTQHKHQAWGCCNFWGGPEALEHVGSKDIGTFGAVACLWNGRPSPLLLQAFICSFIQWTFFFFFLRSRSTLCKAWCWIPGAQEWTTQSLSSNSLQTNREKEIKQLPKT